MTERERLIKVLKGDSPDRVPWFADLGHWYRAESGQKWDLFNISNCTEEIVDLHREVRAGWYVEVGSLHEEYFENGVVRERDIIGDRAVERFRTPIGEIAMERRWSPVSFSWDITKLMVENIKDLEILLYAIEQKEFKPKYENWKLIEQTGGDVQPPAIFRKYSFTHYKAIAEHLHGAGKSVSTHIDGMIGGIIGILAEAGIDVADACTPKPTGDLTPVEIRKQAGNNMILMGGISPVMWLPSTNEKEFIAHVREWLNLRKINSRLVQSAGDQVPPGTELKRIKLVYDIVEEYGRF